MRINFEHRQSAHCESGVISNLLNFHGVKISEPMAFGMGSGLFFSHMPFIKVNGMPVTSYRIWPGEIVRRLTKRLGIKMKKQKFKTPEAAMDCLDETLDRGLPVGMLTGVFYLPYLPKAFRFHFNAHNIAVFGKENDDYLVSDPVMDAPATISRQDLIKARFAKGIPEPKGKMYYPVEVPQHLNFAPAIEKGIKQTAKDMLHIPIPFFGLKSIRYLSKKVRKYPHKLGEKMAKLYIGNIIRMQEEIGTGGAGFRFLFAAFLQEAAELSGEKSLFNISSEMTAIGDRWREFAFIAGRICKGRNTVNENYDVLSDILVECAEREEKIFRKLMNLSWNPKAHSRYTG